MAAANGTHSEIRKVLVVGGVYPATPIIREFENAGFEVHVAHPRDRSSSYKKVTFHECDVDGESLKPVLSEVKPDVVISTVYGNASERQKGVIDAVVEAGIPRFMPYEYGHDSLNEKIQERLSPNNERARVIEYLRKLSDDGKISWVAVATGIDLSRGLLDKSLGFDVKWESATLHGEGGERFASSTSKWIGRVILAAVQNWDSVKNQYLYASGLTTSGDEVVAAFEKATGKEFVTSRTSNDHVLREAESRIKNGYPDAAVYLMGRSVMYDDSIGAVKPFEENDAKKKLGLEGEKLDDIVNWVLHEIQHHDSGGCGCD